MATKHARFHDLLSLKSQLQNLSDTSLRLFHLTDFEKGVIVMNAHPIIDKLWGKGLVEAIGSPIVMQGLELISECIAHYNLDTKKILLLNDNVLLSIDWEMIGGCL